MDDTDSAHRPRPGPGPAAHARQTDGLSRRWFLAGGGAIVVAAGTGVAAELVHHRGAARPGPRPPPEVLLAAVAAERALIADLDATTGGAPAVREVITQSRADHAAHLRTLSALVAGYDAPAAAASTSVSPGTPRTLAELRAAEQRASSAAAHRAATLHSQLAALLASIAACEATHAELLK